MDSKTRARVQVDLARARMVGYGRGQEYWNTLRTMLSLKDADDKAELTVHLFDENPNIRVAAKILLEELDDKN